MTLSQHTARVQWDRQGSVFLDNRYSRAHTWVFDGGARVAASSSPHVVRVPFSEPANVDPEEAFVAALASCHMLWFLGIAAGRGYRVDHYADPAEGFMSANTEGKQWLGRIVLRPDIVFSGAKAPDEAAVGDMHHAAHAACFLANSVKTDISIAGSWSFQAAAGA
jgi:organic hydroperoxide reductase OsmC/OhrA